MGEDVSRAVRGAGVARQGVDVELAHPGGRFGLDGDALRNSMGSLNPFKGVSRRGGDDRQDGQERDHDGPPSAAMRMRPGSFKGRGAVRRQD